MNAIADDEESWLAGDVDDLPLYATDIVARHASSQGRSCYPRLAARSQRWRGAGIAAGSTLSCWLTRTDPIRAAVAPTTVVITRVIGLAPELAEATVRTWWTALQPQAVIKVTNQYVTIGAPAHDGHATAICHLPVTMRRSWRSRALHLELGLMAWSAFDTELDLRPRRLLGEPSRYFRVGHAMMDRIADDLRGLTGPAPAHPARRARPRRSTLAS